MRGQGSFRPEGPDQIAEVYLRLWDGRYQFGACVAAK